MPAGGVLLLITTLLKVRDDLEYLRGNSVQQN